VVLEAAETLLGAVGSAVLAFGASGPTRLMACRGLSENFARAMTGRAPWSEPVRGGAPILVGDVRSDLAPAPEITLFQQQGVLSFAMLPLFAGGKALGKLIVCHGEPQPTLRDPRIARAIAAHAASALGRFSAVASPNIGDSSFEMFTGILGHELRTPLQAILFSAHVALMNDDALSRGKALARITASGQRMARLIDQLFDFTRARAGGGIPINAAPIDVVLLLKVVLDELKEIHEGSMLNIEQVTGDTRGVWDRDRLSQVFMNLVANALNHGVRAFGVRIAVDGTAADVVHVDVHNMGAVPDALVSHLFEPLLHRAGPGKHGGLGLGLYISQEIARAHGGAISVRSSEPEGTTFRVTLPRSSRMPG
jgi:signal transduction histidine kinase